jgi:hypothetical protein
MTYIVSQDFGIRAIIQDETSQDGGKLCSAIMRW